MQHTVIYHEGRLPMFGISGEFGAQVGRRMGAAIAKGKKTPILENMAVVTGRVERDGEGNKVIKASGPVGKLQLGSGHIYRRESNAGLIGSVLESICHIGNGGMVFLDAEPSYCSSAATNSGNRISMTEGSNSLISAMHAPLDWKYHAAIREKLRLFFGVEFALRELLLALPCSSALEMAGMPKGYAIPGPVPLHDIAVLNDCDGEVLEEFCMSEAPMENLRRGGGLNFRELVRELVGMVKGMANSVEMPGTSW